MTEQCKKSIRFKSGEFDGNLFCILDKGHDGICQYDGPTPTIFWLGNPNEDEYVHIFFTTKEKALNFLKKHKPKSWYGELSETDIEKIVVDPQ